MSANNPFAKYPEIIYAVSNIKDGNMSYKWGDPEVVVKNRRQFLEKIGFTANQAIMMLAEGGTDIAIVNQADAGKGMLNNSTAIKVDGLITDERGIALCLMTADCLPISFYDPVKHVIALGHLGWRGTDSQLVKKLILQLKEEFSSKPSDLVAAMGPGIHKESYIFDEAVQKDSPSWQPYLNKLSDGNTSIDVLGYNRQQLLDSGIQPNHLFVSDIDTAASDEYFSHYHASRIGKHEGRFLTAISLKK